MPTFLDLPIPLDGRAALRERHAPDVSAPLPPTLKEEPNPQYRRVLWVGLEVPGGRIKSQDDASRTVNLTFVIRVTRSNGATKFEKTFTKELKQAVSKDWSPLEFSFRTESIDVPVGHSVEVQFEIRNVLGCSIDLSQVAVAYADGSLRLEGPRMGFDDPKP